MISLFINPPTTWCEEGDCNGMTTTQSASFHHRTYGRYSLAINIVLQQMNLPQNEHWPTNKDTKTQSHNVQWAWLHNYNMLIIVTQPLV